MAEKLPCKIVFVGSTRSGVSTLIRRITDKPFIESQKANTLPLGVEVHLKKHWKEGRDVLIWDVSSSLIDAPSEHFSDLCQGVNGFVFVLDGSNILESAHEVDRWLFKLSSFLPSTIPKLLIINKVDRFLENRNLFLTNKSKSEGASMEISSDEWLTKVTSNIGQWVKQGDTLDGSGEAQCPQFPVFIDYCYSVGDARFVDYDPMRGDNISLKQWTPQQAMEMLLNHIHKPYIVSQSSKDDLKKDGECKHQTLPTQVNQQVRRGSMKVIRPLRGPIKPMRRSMLKAYEGKATETTSSAPVSSNSISSTQGKEEQAGPIKAQLLWKSLFGQADEDETTTQLNEAVSQPVTSSPSQQCVSPTIFIASSHDPEREEEESRSEVDTSNLDKHMRQCEALYLLYSGAKRSRKPDTPVPKQCSSDSLEEWKEMHKKLNDQYLNQIDNMISDQVSTDERVGLNSSTQNTQEEESITVNSQELSLQTPQEDFNPSQYAKYASALFPSMECLNHTRAKGQSLKEELKKGDAGWNYFAGYMGKSESEQLLQVPLF